MKYKKTYTSAYLKKGHTLMLKGPEFVDLTRDVLNKGLSFRFKANGFSMSPFIRFGDLITLCPVRNQSPSVGDVVAFVLPGSKKLVVHRVIKKMKNDFLISGDNIPMNDGIVPMENIIGYIGKIERGGKEIHLGFGKERFLIAYLSRIGLLYPSIHFLSGLMNLLKKRLVVWKT